MIIDKLKHILFTVMTIALAVVSGQADVFRMQSDRLWYRAEEEPLEDLMVRFAQLGARVEYDPAIQMMITADFRGGTLDDFLNQVLSPLGFVATWDVVQGPIDDFLLLNSLKVYRPGQLSAARPYDTARRREIVSQGGREFVANEVLIGFRASTTRRDVEMLLGQLGGTITGSVKGLGIYRIRFPDGTDVPTMIERLKNSQIVAGAEPNYVNRLPIERTGVDSTAEMQLNNMVFASGQTAYLAVLDSGLSGDQLPPELIAGRFDALDPDADLGDATGHGTRMAIIASGLVSPGGISGRDEVQGVPLLAIRAFDEEGITSNFDLMRAVKYAVDSGARVINMSWGTEFPSDFIATTMSYANSEGLLVVASAGNEPSGQQMYPAAYPGVLGIAATVDDGSYWEQSNYGDFIFASAPGMAVLPTLNGPDQGVFGGTSISSALVAGTIARYIALNPHATPEQIISRLDESLSPPADGNLYRGRGVMDEAAIRRFLEIQSNQ